MQTGEASQLASGHVNKGKEQSAIQPPKCASHLSATYCHRVFWGERQWEDSRRGNPRLRMAFVNPNIVFFFVWSYCPCSAIPNVQCNGVRVSLSLCSTCQVSTCLCKHLGFLFIPKKVLLYSYCGSFVADFEWGRFWSSGDTVSYFLQGAKELLVIRGLLAVYQRWVLSRDSSLRINTMFSLNWLWYSRKACRTAVVLPRFFSS